MQIKSISKVSIVTLISISIIACSSGGHHSAANSTPQINNEQAAAIEANRVALVAKAKAAGLTDAQAAAYADANKEATTQNAQTALDTIVAANKAAAIEANRVALVAKAKAAGLTDAQAAAYADANKEATTQNAQTALDTIVAANEKAALAVEIANAKGFGEGTYQINTITANTRASSSNIRNNLTSESRIQSVVYNQPYSVVLGNYTGEISYNNKTAEIISDNRISNIDIKGLKTAIADIPTLGSATYTGLAFNGTYSNETNIDYSNGLPSTSTISEIHKGQLNYTVNFTDRIGSGSITGLGNTINLEQGSISGTGINATATQSYKSGTYSLDFYGKKAEEIAGKVVFNGKDTVGFGGTRGEIK